jgi:hypothetical protein
VTLAGRRKVIFVGGTPFSGADVVAELLDGHPGAVALPVRLRFHSDPRGIPALLGGRIGLEDFVAELESRDVAMLVSQEALDTAIATFRTAYEDDPIDACRALFWTLLDGVAADEAAGTLVEASPENLHEAHTLARLVPEARFAHVVRDGRDVAAAAAEAGAAPHRLIAAVEWWADGLREVERGIRGEEDGASYAVPEERLATVVLDELAVGDRESAHRDLLERLDLDVGASLPPDASARLEPAAVGRGRWRTLARGPGAWRLSRRYAGALDELLDERNHAAEPLLAARERLG